MKPTALFTLDDQNVHLHSPLQQAQLAEDITFLFALESLVRAHELELQASTPDPPEDAMDYGEVEALIKALQQPPVALAGKNEYRYYKWSTVRRVLLLAFASVAILWIIWEIVAWIHSILQNKI